MDIWYTETHKHTRFGMRIRASLEERQTDFQHLAIVDTHEYGRVMLLDGLVMLTERDEFIYHEMLSHVPLLSHPHPKRVLIIGGGDGGTLREVCRHPEVEEAHLCEIDGAVIEAAKKYFPALKGAFDHPKATVFVEDGLAFVDRIEEPYDVIIVDSTDPIGPAVGLFQGDFQEKVKASLRPDGIFTQQTESPYADPDIVGEVYASLRKTFAHVSGYAAFIPTYPSGMWTFSLASAERSAGAYYGAERAQALMKNGGMRYYNPALHRGAFALPTFAMDVIYGDSGRRPDW